MKKLILLTLTLIPSLLYAGGVNLTWSDNSDNEEGFIIERKSDGGEFVEIARTTQDVSKYLDSSPIVGAMNTYRVKAFNSFGDSGYTNESGKGAYVPDDPSGLNTIIELNLNSQPVTYKENVEEYRKYVSRDWRG